MLVDCPHCYMENKIYVELWQAMPNSNPVITTCEECGKLFGSKFDIFLTQQSWKIMDREPGDTMSSKLESKFKKDFKDEVTDRWPDVEMYEPNATSRRSSADLVLLFSGGWAALEFKREEDSARQPNQDYKIERLKEKGYASFVYPENREAVLNDLENLLTT